MTLSRRLHVFSSGEPGEVRELEETLEHLKGVRIELVQEAPMLKQHIELPFIETAGGSRHFGMSAITRYVEAQTELGTARGQDAE